MKILLSSLMLSLLPGLVVGQTKTASEIIEASLNLWRGDTSYSVTEMTIHRPEWQREMRLEGWTRGMKDSLTRFVYPPRDADNATLKLDNEMWIFTPKLNRVTKLPASMMTQSWMGSDFSYNDLARSDQTLENYNHTLLETREQDGYKVYIIEALPKPNAPVVWGKEVAKIRDDYVMLENVFYDQSMQEVKSLKTLEIDDIDGRPFPTVMRITKTKEPDQWTEIRTSQVLIDINLPDYLFTLANLQRPRPWKP